MVKRSFVWSIILLFSLSLTSCIELLEEISVNEDKSGYVFIGIESKLLGSLLGMAKDQVDPSVIAEIEKFPNESKEKLSKVKGITKINSFDQLNSGRIGFSFHFDKPSSLNQAYYALFDMEKKIYNPNIVSISKHKVKRRNLTPQLVEQIDIEKPGFKDADYIKYLNYKIVVKVPSTTKSIENGNLTNSVGSKKVIMKYSATAILKDEKSTAFKIRF